jgi:hypothetical protein
MKKIFLLLAVIPGFSNAQLAFRFNDSIPVTQYGNTLVNAWAGGINYPQWGEIDVNNDGLNDLFMFDRSNNRVLTLINNGNPNPSAFRYVDAFKTHYPKLGGWITLNSAWAAVYDYNFDGYPDLFSVSKQNSGIIQFRGNYDGVNGYTFTCVDSVVKYKFGVNQESNVLASANLVADFNDLDNDGDMDIIAQQLSCVGTYAYYRNYNKEDGFPADSVNNYRLITNDWGNFVLRPGGYSNVIVNSFHDTTCFDPGPFLQWHPGDIAPKDDTYSAVKSIDLDGDGDKDALVGDSQAFNLLAIYNGGDSSYADMDTQDTLFPGYDTPVMVKSFSAPSYADVDNDGLKDLLAGNSEFENRRGIKWYKNTNTNPAPVFDFQTDSLFQPGMIDVGEAAAAVFADVDNDGLADIVIGNSRSTYNFSQEKTNLTYYKNTGTATNPSFLYVTDDFASASSLGISGPLYPAFGDMDGDGDKDMILGCFTGILNYFTNNAGTFNFTSTNYMNIDVGNGSTPQIIDADRDGVLDLVVGEQNGFLNYFRNLGTTMNAFFNSVPTASPFGGVNVHAQFYVDGYSVPFLYDDSGAYKLLVANMEGNILLFDSIDGNLGGSFHFVDTVFSSYYGYRYGYNCSVSGTDLNADGRTDVLIGLYGGGVQVFYQVDPFMAVNEIAKPSSQFTVYPNPAYEMLNVTVKDFSRNQNYSLSIFNSIGQLIMHTRNVKEKMQLDVKEFPEGVYLVKLETLYGNVSQKILLRSTKY